MPFKNNGASLCEIFFFVLPRWCLFPPQSARLVTSGITFRNVSAYTFFPAANSSSLVHTGGSFWLQRTCSATNSDRTARREWWWKSQQLHIIVRIYCFIEHSRHGILTLLAVGADIRRLLKPLRRRERIDEREISHSHSFYVGLLTNSHLGGQSHNHAKRVGLYTKVCKLLRLGDSGGKTAKCLVLASMQYSQSDSA